MSKKRGLSVEEKRQKLKELFVETKEVFLLKELEKKAPKEKGITAQTVKEILQSLVDDDIVKTDKVGTSNVFWCFPSDEVNQRHVKKAKLTKDVESAVNKLEQLTQEKKEAMKGRDTSEERTKKLEKLFELRNQNAEYRKQLQQLADNNPELVNAMREDAEIARAAANRWTDNIWSIKSYCVNKFNIEASAFDKNFEIPPDFDYI